MSRPFEEPSGHPREAAEELADYLRHARPSCPTWLLFVRLKPRHHGLRSTAAVCDIVRRAPACVGIDPPNKGAHLLRHSLAADILRDGASLGEIGQILRRRHLDTTRIYAKEVSTAFLTSVRAALG